MNKVNVIIAMGFFLAVSQVNANQFCGFLGSYCGDQTPFFRGMTKAAAYQACSLGAGLVKSGVPLAEVIRVCSENYPFDDIQIRKLLDLGVFSKEEIALFPIMRSTCLGSSAAYKAACLK
ncbi:MAG: hypothetical protein ACK5V3_13490 [Bdellovibrionales bacterium]